MSRQCRRNAGNGGRAPDPHAGTRGGAARPKQQEYIGALSREPERTCAIAVFGMPAQQVVDHLMARHRIFTVVRPIVGGEGVRVTPHLFTTTAQLDLLVAAIGELA